MECVTQSDKTGAPGVSGMLPRYVDAEAGGLLLEHVDINTDVSFAALVAFATVDEFGHYGKAANFLGKQQQGLRQHVKNLEQALNAQLLDTGPGGEYRAVGPVGLELRDRARMLVYQYGAIGRLRDNSIRIHYLPQHGFFMASVEARLDGVVDLRTTTLGEESRSTSRFYDNVIVPLAAGMIDLTVGQLPPESSPPAELLSSEYLYSSRLEAMVPAGDPRERVSLRALVEQARMLVPPPSTYSRAQLERELARDVPDDPGPEVRVKREAHGTKVLIQYGMKGLGTVILPSGIAYPFYYGNDYGGPAAADFKWIPVHRSSGELIYQPVYAITRRVRDRSTDQVAKILKLVRQEVAKRGLEHHPDAHRQR
jgi:DNA-binding transcriptional LysR family regulator